MQTAKDSDFKFKECYGRDTADTKGISIDYNSVVPESIAHLFNELKQISEKIDGSLNVDKTFVSHEIDDLISSYELIKSNCPHNNISRDMSSLIIGCSQIYDEEMCNFITQDVIRGSSKPVSSRFTSVVYDAITLNDDSIDEQLSSLINTVIEYFDPCIVAKVLSSIIIKHKDCKFFTKERVKGYYEALINRENAIYSGKYIPIIESVGYTYYETTYTTPLDVLSDKHGVYELIKMGTNNVYGDIFKRTITNELLNNILQEADGKEDSQTILVLKYLRDEVVSWVKHKNLDERPEYPDSFKYIDMTHFLANLYLTGIHILGDSEIIISKFDKEYETLDDKIYHNELKADEAERAKVKMNNIKERKNEYLRLKSYISFLFMEIMSNEKMVYKVFSEELAASIILTEPPFDFGMNDVCYNVAASFAKNDYTPANYKSINPCYIHYGEQELSTPNAFYLASVITALMHPNMRSASSTAGIFNFESLETALKSLKYHYFKAYDIFMKIVEGCEKRITGLCSQYKSETPEDICKIVESGMTVSKAYEISKIFNEKVVDKEYSDTILHLQSSVIEICSMNDWFEGYTKSLKNILGQIEDIISNVSSDDCISSAKALCVVNKPMINLWPITQSYEFPIDKEAHSELKANTHNHIDTYVPGDIINGRYKSDYDDHTRNKSRYSMTNPDK